MLKKSKSENLIPHNSIMDKILEGVLESPPSNLSEFSYYAIGSLLTMGRTRWRTFKNSHWS